jgi:hypothetical protein
MNIEFEKGLRRTENIHIVLWLIKDICWVLNFRIGGMIMIVPTLLVAMYITWKGRNYRSELFHNIAVCLWISANINWMIGEFYYDDTTRPLSIVFFALGLAFIFYYYIIERLLLKRSD